MDHDPRDDGDDDDEFTLLRAEAEQFAIAWTVPPYVRRAAVATGGGTVSALVWGESAPRVALLHGGGLNAHTWDATLLALDEPAVAVDLPGTATRRGATTRTTGPRPSPTASTVPWRSSHQGRSSWWVSRSAG
jgi:pimeloyl-ACP methyl ester carboxylesterase